MILTSEALWDWSGDQGEIIYSSLSRQMYDNDQHDILHDIPRSLYDFSSELEH